MSENATFDINAVIDTAKKVVTQPREFYAQMDKTGGYTNPMIFVVTMGLAAGIIGAIFSFFSSGHVAGMSIGIASIIIMPIAAVIGSFICAAIMFVIWKLMGSAEDYETAYRCVAYSFVFIVVSVIAAIIPYLGTIVATAWWFWLMIQASIEVHNLDKQKSLIVLGVIGAIVVLLNISGERTQRHFEGRVNELENQLGEIKSMTPEEIGQAAGELLKGLQQGVEDD